MPIRFSGSARPRKLKSPDPINIPAIREDRLPIVKKNVEFYKEYGFNRTYTMFDYTRPSGYIGNTVSQPFACATVQGSPVISYEGDFNGFRTSALSPWGVVNLYERASSGYYTFEIYPDDNFSLSFRFGQISYSTNQATMMIFEEYLGSSVAPLLIWAKDANGTDAMYQRFKINSVSLLGNYSAVPGTDFNFLSIDSFELRKEGNTVSLYANGNLVDSALWPFTEVYKPILRVQNYKAACSLKDLKFNIG